MIASLWACSKKNDLIKPDYSNIKGEIRNGSKLKSSDDIVVRAVTTMWSDNWIGTAQKNDSLTAILIPSVYIISSESNMDGRNGVLRDGKDDFLCGIDFIIRDDHQKVIAYVPNKDMRIAEVLIINAFKKGRVDSCIFYLKTKYRFVKTTDAEWRKLKLEGKN